MRPRRTMAALGICALPWVSTACQASDAGTASHATHPPTPTVRVLQPGKPGEPNVVATGGSAATPTPALDPDDTRFMQDMISHHAQALRMVVVARKLLTDTQTKAIASRIEASQRPEIDAMARWLTARGQSVPLEATHPLVAPSDGHQAMPGMATDQQLEALARMRGSDADRLFLTLMIAHHEGALVMALDQRKYGTDDRATELSDDVSVTQTAEIDHMRQMLTRLGG